VASTSNKARAKRATIHDVAKYAGVSTSSVSRVLNQYSGIHPHLRSRVEEAIQELSYVPAKHKKRWPETGSRLFYFILTNRNLHIPFHSKTLQAIENECSRKGDLLLFRTLQYSPETPPEDLQLARVLEFEFLGRDGTRPHGVILTGPTYQNLLQALQSLSIPYILLGNNFGGTNLGSDAVTFDGHQGSYEATRYLRDLGHTQILFIADPSVSWYAPIYEGYLRAMNEAGLNPIAQTKTLSDSFYSNGYLSVEIAFEQFQGITAIFAGYDETALGAWKALDDRNLSVPRDVSLIGFDDEDYAAFTVPPLTTVRIDVESLGRELINQLYRKIERPLGTVPIVTLGTTLVKRGTCRPLKTVSAPA
jgi:LacI family transcriptional regulator